MRTFLILRLGGLLFFLLPAASIAQAQQDSAKKITTGIFSNPKLKPYRQQANEYYSSYKNRFALEDLKKMDAAADTLAVSDLEAAEQNLKQKRESETKEQTIKITEQNALIKSLTDQNDVLRSERNKSWRKAIISILLWFAMVALYLIYRMKMFSGTSKVLEESKTALANAEKFNEKGEKLTARVAANEPVLNEAGQAGDQLVAALQQAATPLPDRSDEMTQSVEVLKAMRIVNHSLLLLSEELPDEKKPLDVNALCNQMVLLTNHGIETEDGLYHFTISKDMEKKLPLVKANEQGLARVIIFLISNALNACYSHSKSGLKGYQPKITVSTRVLPRFVQIRVKDNGAGVTDEILEKVYDPYFTTEPLKKAGLGLTLSKEIIGKNKGEMKIESSLDRGTDVTIKLFL